MQPPNRSSCKKTSFDETLMAKEYPALWLMVLYAELFKRIFVRMVSMRNKKYGLVLISAAMLLLANVRGSAQKEQPQNKNRLLITAASIATMTTTSYVLLNELWYKDYARSKFHFFNDNREWLQMDKAGHLMTTYNIGRYGYDVFRWSGLNENQSTWIAGTLGLAYLTGVEFMDGKSTAWGFSNGDMIANACGSFLFIAQQKIWHDQRIRIKFSFTSSEFSEHNPAQLGRNFQQRVLKDYNAQTYWATFNIHSFLTDDAVFPRWLNVAIGYGATEMITAKNIVDDVNNFHRKREFYFSFDADLDRVQWKKKWMKQMMKILSFIKIPGPTLEIRNDGKVKMHGVFF